MNNRKNVTASTHLLGPRTPGLIVKRLGLIACGVTMAVGCSSSESKPDRSSRDAAAPVVDAATADSGSTKRDGAEPASDVAVAPTDDGGAPATPDSAPADASASADAAAPADATASADATTPSDATASADTGPLLPPPPGALGPGGASKCEPGSTSCLGFETGLLPATWEPQRRSANMTPLPTVSGAKPYRGVYGLDLLLPKSAMVGTTTHHALAMLRLRTFPATTTKLFGRLWYFVEKDYPTTEAYSGHGHHVKTCVGDLATGVCHEVGFNLKKLTISKMAGGYTTTETAMPIGKWACLQWSVDTEAGKVTATLDGTPHEQTIAAGGSIGYLEVGFVSHHIMASENHVYIDEVAIGSSPIGCND